MSTPDPTLLAEVLRHALDGVAVVEGSGGAPRVVYANATLAGLLRRAEEWLPGKALEEIESEAPADPNATTVGVGQRVRLRRADGTTVECERWALMLPDSRLALYYRPLPRSAPGALAAAIDRGAAWPRALAEGVAAGSLACLRPGAQSALPAAAAISELARSIEPRVVARIRTGRQPQPRRPPPPAEPHLPQPRAGPRPPKPLPPPQPSGGPRLALTQQELQQPGRELGP
mgnify:CR=1 FL=1